VAFSGAEACRAVSRRWCVENKGFPVKKINQNGPVQFFLYAVRGLRRRAARLLRPHARQAHRFQMFQAMHGSRSHRVTLSPCALCPAGHHHRGACGWEPACWQGQWYTGRTEASSAAERLRGGGAACGGASQGRGQCQGPEAAPMGSSHRSGARLGRWRGAYAKCMQRRPRSPGPEGRARRCMSVLVSLGTTRAQRELRALRPAPAGGCAPVPAPGGDHLAGLLHEEDDEG
jgi:hypothetical protein